MHGLEPQTIESLNMLRGRKAPFIVALNKIDRLFDWKEQPNAAFRDTLKAQKEYVQEEFYKRASGIMLEFAEQGLNSELYFKNTNIKEYVSIVPTSAITGEGLPDLLMLIVQLTQKLMSARLTLTKELQCTVLEVKQIEGLGTTIDVILVNGTLYEGDTIVVAGLQGPIVTNVRALLTPHPMKELRVKGQYLHHKVLHAAMGVKIGAPGLEHAIAGSTLYVCGPDDDVDELKEEAQMDVSETLERIDTSGVGVCVQASTLGSLEALLDFLETSKIPVSGVQIGPVHKKDIMRASVMHERKKPEYATILAFDVKVEASARDLAEELDVKVFTADIIYHLFDQFTAYMKQVKEEKQKAVGEEAVFPCVLQIIPEFVFGRKDPIILGCTVIEGIARVGTPICVPTQNFIAIGRITSIEKNRSPVQKLEKGQQGAFRIEGKNQDETSRMYGRHFDHNDKLVSKISRRSIDLLKENFREEVSKEEWQLLVGLKKMFSIE